MWASILKYAWTIAVATGLDKKVGGWIRGKLEKVEKKVEKKLEDVKSTLIEFAVADTLNKAE